MKSKVVTNPDFYSLSVCNLATDCSI